MKRKSDTPPRDQDTKDAKQAKNEQKTEYKKLRRLVPALQERTDITKVIYYIDKIESLNLRTHVLGISEARYDI